MRNFATRRAKIDGHTRTFLKMMRGWELDLIAHTRTIAQWGEFEQEAIKASWRIIGTINARIGGSH